MALEVCQDRKLQPIRCSSCLWVMFVVLEGNGPEEIDEKLNNFLSPFKINVSKFYIKVKQNLTITKKQFQTIINCLIILQTLIHKSHLPDSKPKNPQKFQHNSRQTSFFASLPHYIIIMATLLLQYYKKITTF